jgi:flagellar hook-associated protein 2
LASTIFTGASRYSSDFQAVIDRAVSIASLPMTQMQQNKLSTTDESTALKTLGARVAQLQNSLSGLSEAFGMKSYSVSNSNGSIASAQVSDGVAAGTYTLKVLDLGSYATATSKSSLPVVTDPASQSIDAATEYTLTVNGGDAITIKPAANNLNSLVDAINSSNSGVQATVVNLSPNGTPEYHLSLQSKTLGAATISFTGSTELLDTPVGGAVARYIINGRVEESKSTSRTITLSTGLTVDLLKEDASSTTTISVTRSTSGLKSAIEGFISNYNGIVDELDKHSGDAKGALTGNSIVASTNAILRRIGSYANSDSNIGSLASIGVLTDRFGKLYLDPTEWDKVKNDMPGLKSFIGTSGSSGFLKAAGDQIDALHADKTGLLTTAITITDDQAERADARIAQEQQRIDDLKENLQNQFFAADALIASLEQQATYFTNMFAAMKSAQDSMN